MPNELPYTSPWVDRIARVIEKNCRVNGRQVPFTYIVTEAGLYEIDGQPKACVPGTVIDLADVKLTSPEGYRLSPDTVWITGYERVGNVFKLKAEIRETVR